MNRRRFFSFLAVAPIAVPTTIIAVGSASAPSSMARQLVERAFAEHKENIIAAMEQVIATPLYGTYAATKLSPKVRP